MDNEHGLASVGGAAVTLEEIRRDWTLLGATEPLWAVCVDPTKRDGGWDDEAFLASGAAEIDATLGRLADLGWPPPESGRALDFGCGAGRLTHGLRAHFAETVGVDVSPSMLSEARRLLGDPPDLTLLLNESPRLPTLESDSFDLVYCDLVLQHMPGDLARGYLAEFVRVLRPGGTLVVGVPVRERHTFKGLVFRYAPNALIRLAQRRILGYPAPMRMHTVATRALHGFVAGRGGTLLARDEYWAGDHWEHRRHFFVFDHGGT